VAGVGYDGALGATGSAPGGPASGPEAGGETVGLTFSVGGPSVVFQEPYAGHVLDALQEQFGDAIGPDGDGGAEPYTSAEVAWSGWGLLQERAAQELGAENVPHLLSMDAWCGAYVPAETDPGSFAFEGEETPLDVASLDRLADELEALGLLTGLPTDDDGLRDLAARYQADDLVDDDLDVQTYAHLLLAAHAAQARRQTLWMVK